MLKGMMGNAAVQRRSGFMSEVEFWYMIHEARKVTKSTEELASHITATLSKRNVESILGFDYWFSRFYYCSYTSALWCAAFIAKGGCDDDSFDYFRAWMIGQGQQVYEAAVRNPDSLLLPLEVASTKEKTENESLLIASWKAYQVKTGKDTKAFFDDLDKYETDFGNLRGIKFDWQPDDPDSMRKVCPKLFARFWGNHIA